MRLQSKLYQGLFPSKGDWHEIPQPLVYNILAEIITKHASSLCVFRYVSFAPYTIGQLVSGWYGGTSFVDNVEERTIGNELSIIGDGIVFHTDDGDGSRLRASSLTLILATCFIRSM